VLNIAVAEVMLDRPVSCPSLASFRNALEGFDESHGTTKVYSGLQLILSRHLESAQGTTLLGLWDAIILNLLGTA